jgi:chromosomal replication initiation ATPase DnaA
MEALLGGSVDVDAPLAPVNRSFDDVDRIIAATAAEIGVPVPTLMSGTRNWRVSRPRQLAMYLARETGVSFPKLGDRFGRDHTTILHACREVRRRVLLDPEVVGLLVRIRRRVAAAMAEPEIATEVPGHG